MAIEFADRIRRIPAYPLSAGYDLGDDIAMLASNEACFAPSIEVLDAANRAMTATHRYPDPSYQPLRQALADRYGVPRERIALGNGSCDILLSAGEALLEPGAEVIYAWPAFSVYPHLAAASGARAIEVPLDDEDRHDLDAMAGCDLWFPRERFRICYADARDRRLSLADRQRPNAIAGGDPRRLRTTFHRDRVPSDRDGRHFVGP